MLTRAIAIGLALAARGISADAQDLSSLRTGERVRVIIPEAFAQPEVPGVGRHSLRGNVSRVVADSLFLSIPGTAGELGIARASIKRIDRSRGVPSRPISAIRRGLATAVVVGGFAALTFDLPSHWDANSRGDAALRAAAFGGSVGLVHGALFPTERWRRLR